MKICFVHLGREHLGIEYLSSILKEAGHEVALAYDPGLFGTEDNVFYIPFLEKIFSRKEDVLALIERSAPDLVAFTVYTGTYEWTVDIARIVKERKKVPVVFGGIHPSLVPETVIGNESVDFVVVGEGDQALPALVKALTAEKPNFKKVPNLWYKQNGTVKHNKIAPLVKDLDSLPLPDKALFEKEVNYRDDYMIMAGRGCVFSCSYCCESYINKLYKNKFYRKRSIESIMDELVQMKKRYDFREVMFNDALFFTDRKWLKNLLDRYTKEIGVPFRCFGKVTLLDEELARMLKNAGCYCIEFGMQTVNEQVKRDVLNRTETNARSFETYATCDRVGLNYDIDHMFGLPGERERDHIYGALFYSRLSYLNRLKVHNLTYFPKMPILKRAREEGLLSDANVKDIESGRIGNFFHGGDVKDSRVRRINKCFSVLYKFLPLLPEPWVKYIIRHKWYRAFGSIPSPVIILLQILVAFKGRDYRYILYIKYYLLRIKRKFFK